MKIKDILKFANEFESLADEHFGLVPTDEGKFRPATPKFKKGDLIKVRYMQDKLFVFMQYKHWRDSEIEEEYQSNPKDYEANSIHPKLQCLLTEVKQVKTPEGRTKLVPTKKLFETSYDRNNKRWNDRYAHITAFVKDLELVKAA